MVKTNGVSDSPDEVKARALQILRSYDFFSHLQRAMYNQGLRDKDIALAVALYVIAVSRFLKNPLRVQILERTEGTASYFVEKIAQFLPPDEVVTIRPANDVAWKKLKNSPDGKLVFVSAWERQIPAGVSHLKVSGADVTRIRPVSRDNRIVELEQTIPGRFACISVYKPNELQRQLRWLTLKQPTHDPESGGMGAGNMDFAVWHQVQELLRERATATIIFPDWVEVMIEVMCERDDRTMRHVPALFQLWRTMSVVRSFYRSGQTEKRYLNAGLEDLGEALALSKQVFRERYWFPTTQKLFDLVTDEGKEIGVINPITSKGKKYVHLRKPTKS